MKNAKYLEYTYLHRQAFSYVLNNISNMLTEAERAEMERRAKYHDLDKALLYTLVDKPEASRYHRETAAHHMENGSDKGYYDLLEADIDYECAGFTKADKPRNAYDTIRDFNPNNSSELMSILQRFDMDYHYLNTSNDNGWAEFKKTQEPFSEEAVMRDIYRYMMDNPEEAAKVLEFADSLADREFEKAVSQLGTDDSRSL